MDIFYPHGKRVVTIRHFTAGPNDAGVRLSRFVQGVTLGLPEATMYKGFRNKRIKVNGRRAAPELRLAQGDEIELYLNDAFFPPEKAAYRPPAREDLPGYGTVYRDHGVAILYKPAGVLSHRDASGRPGLLDAFTADLAAAGAYDPARENTFAPALCNRLDRGTEGLLVAATSAAGLRGVNSVIRLGLLEKTYLCICVGRPPQGVFHAHLARERASHSAVVAKDPAAGSKPIATGIKVLEQAGGLALCEVKLLTGRTHQIRAHLAFLGAPLWGDRKYGAAAGPAGAPGGQALCAWRLAFAQNLPQEAGLAGLAGRSFTADMAALPRRWAAWKATGGKSGKGPAEY